MNKATNHCAPARTPEHRPVWGWGVCDLLRAASGPHRVCTGSEVKSYYPPLKAVYRGGGLKP
jgi:hypothetical protein